MFAIEDNLENEEDNEEEGNSTDDEKEHENIAFIDRKTKADLNKLKRKKEFGKKLKEQRNKKKMKMDLEK